MVDKVLAPEERVQDVDPDVSICVMVTVKIEAPGGLQYPMHFLHPFLQPLDVVFDPTRPAVFEAPDLTLIPFPNAFVVPVGEKRGIKIDQVHGLRGQTSQDFQIISQYELIHQPLPVSIPE